MLRRTVIICGAIGAAVALLAGAGIAAAQTVPTVQPDTATTPPGVAVVINVLANDVDPLGSFVPGTVTVASPAANGSAVAGSDGTITYTPAASFTGEDQFSYTVCDSQAVPFCGSAIVTVEVAAVTPTATATASPTLETWPITNPDGASTDQGKPVTINILANDSDAAAAIDNSSLKIVTAPASGTATVDTSSGTATYTPSASFTGTDTFVYQVCDLQASPHCSQGTVTVKVNALATATPTAPPTTVATQTPVTATATATPPVEVATPKPPSTGSGTAPQSPSSLTLALLAIVGFGAIAAAGAVAGYTLTNRAR